MKWGSIKASTNYAILYFHIFTKFESNTPVTMQWRYFVKNMHVIYRIRSSRPKVFYKKGVLQNLSKFTGKQLCQSLFFKKVAGLRHPSGLKTPLCDCFWSSLIKNIWPIFHGWHVAEKGVFLLQIYVVNVKKSAVSCGFAYMY